MNLLDVSVVPRVVNGAEHGRAGLLVDGKDVSSKKGVDEGGLSGVEVPCDEDGGSLVVDSILERGEMLPLCLKSTVEEFSDGGSFEGHDEGTSGTRRTEGEVELKDLEA